MTIPPAATVPATPSHFGLRMRLLTPLELERRRSSETFTPQFANRDYRILWGTESVRWDMSSAPASIRRGIDDVSSGASITIPRAYYGVVSPEGIVSADVVDTRAGLSVLEIGEYRSAAPAGLTADRWVLDQRAARQHFHPLITIPLMRFEPPVVDDASTQVELWWRLWNLGQIDQAQIAPRHPTAAEIPPSDHSLPELTPYQRDAERVYANANRIAKARWNHVRSLIESRAVPATDEELRLQLLAAHDNEGLF